LKHLFINHLGKVQEVPFALVGAGERGVMMRFGKVQNKILDEGIHPILPIVTSIKTLCGCKKPT
jgi:hypothetical protein